MLYVHVYMHIFNLREFVLTTVIMAPGACKPRLGAPKNAPFPDLRDLKDLRDLRDRVPGASFGCTETMV